MNPIPKSVNDYKALQPQTARKRSGFAFNLIFALPLCCTYGNDCRGVRGNYFGQNCCGGENQKTVKALCDDSWTL